MFKSQDDEDKKFRNDLLVLAAMTLAATLVLTCIVKSLFGWTCVGIVGVLLAGLGSLVGLTGTIWGATRSRRAAADRAMDVRDLKEVRKDLRILGPKWETRKSESPVQRENLEVRKKELTEKQRSLEEKLLGSDKWFEVFSQMTRPLVPWVIALCLIAGGLFMRLASLLFQSKA